MEDDAGADDGGEDSAGGGGLMATITLDQKIAALRREIRMRERVYPNRVAEGKMRQDQADAEVAVMKAILEDYEAHKPAELDMFKN